MFTIVNKKQLNRIEMKINEAISTVQASTVQAIQSQAVITSKISALQSLVTELMTQISDVDLTPEQDSIIQNLAQAINNFDVIGNNIVIPVDTSTSSIG